jgi:hypothetical protein
MTPITEYNLNHQGGKTMFCFIGQTHKTELAEATRFLIDAYKRSGIHDSAFETVKAALEKARTTARLNLATHQASCDICSGRRPEPAKGRAKVSFLDDIDTSFLDDFDVESFDYQLELDQLWIDIAVDAKIRSLEAEL